MTFTLPTVTDPLQIVATAVTPVVMVSATAILAGGINSRYMSIADRVRSLAREFRDPATQEQRRIGIVSQMEVFVTRIHLIAWAIRMGYTAMACFVLMALVITATAFRQFLIELTVPLFILGIGFVVAAIVFQLMELNAANKTIHLEVADVVPDHHH